MQYPEMVKTNARHRGPRESEKQINSVMDIQASIARIVGVLQKQSVKRKALGEKIMTDYNHTRPQMATRLYHEIKAVRGGEI